MLFVYLCDEDYRMGRYEYTKNLLTLHFSENIYRKILLSNILFVGYCDLHLYVVDEENVHIIPLTKDNFEIKKAHLEPDIRLPKDKIIMRTFCHGIGPNVIYSQFFLDSGHLYAALPFPIGVFYKKINLETFEITEHSLELPDSRLADVYGEYIFVEERGLFGMYKDCELLRVFNSKPLLSPNRKRFILGDKIHDGVSELRMPFTGFVWNSDHTIIYRNVVFEIDGFVKLGPGKVEKDYLGGYILTFESKIFKNPYLLTNVRLPNSNAIDYLSITEVKRASKITYLVNPATNQRTIVCIYDTPKNNIQFNQTVVNLAKTLKHSNFKYFLATSEINQDLFEEKETLLKYNQLSNQSNLKQVFVRRRNMITKCKETSEFTIKLDFCSGFWSLEETRYLKCNRIFFNRIINDHCQKIYQQLKGHNIYVADDDMVEGILKGYKHLLEFAHVLDQLRLEDNNIIYTSENFGFGVIDYLIQNGFLITVQECNMVNSKLYDFFA